MTDDDRTVAPDADPDRTIITPQAPASPYGAATVTLVPERPKAASTAGDPQGGAMPGLNALVSAANPILNIVHVLRTTATHVDAHTLHLCLLEAIETFERRASAKAIPRHKVIAARFVLCTLLDEVIAGTPWGSAPAWTAPRLLEHLHSERHGGERVFELLARLGEDPRANTDLLELFHICLALGLQGRYRNAPNGRAQLDAAARRVFELIQPAEHPVHAVAGAGMRALADHWHGTNPPQRRIVTELPLWSIVALGVASLLALYLYLNSQVNATAAPLFRHIHEIAAQLAPPSRSNPAPGIARLTPALAEAARSGLLDVREDALRSTVALSTDAAFVPGTTQLDALAKPAIGRIAAALAPLAGQILVIGHTDNTPISTVRFPSSWHLSRDRASAVATALAQAGLPAERMRIEGRGDANPLAPNDAPDGRARNRRVEIQLVLPRPDR